MKQPLRGEFILGLIAWTIIVAVSLAANIIQYQRQTLNEAALEARTHLDLVLSYRRLIASFGGVYAPIEAVSPNPYLIHPKKNITTTGGLQLTLVNPAYLTRLVFDSIRARQETPVLDRITSTKPFNPANAPDAWEKQTLLAFEQGLSEATETLDIAGKPYLRLMQPFMTEEDCLNCHGQQGYKTGDIRGGISVSVPLAHYYAGNALTKRNLIVSHAAIWLLVCCGLVLVAIRRRRSTAELEASEKRIATINRLYAVLSRVNEAIVRVREPQSLYQEICRISVEEGLFRMAWIGIVDPNTLLVKPVAVHGHEDGYLTVKIISTDERIPEGGGQTGIAIRAGGHYLCNDLASDPIMLPWRDEALKRGYRSSAAFALLKSGKAIGSINVYADTPHFFREEEAALLQRLADDTSYAVAAIDSDRELTLAHDTLLTILNSLDAVVYVADMKTYEVLYTNKYVTDVFGDVTGRICWQALQSGQTGPCPFCTNERLLDDGGNPTGMYGWQFENTVVGRWYDIRDRAIRWIDGRIVRLEIAADITDLKKAEAGLIRYRDDLERLVAERTRDLEGKTQQLGQSELALLNVVEDLNKAADDLKIANERLKELDRLKSLFIASMSHELRTPLNSVIGFSSIILDEWSGPLNDEQKKELAVVKRSGKHLLALINDIIDVSKVEAGTIEVATTDFDLHDLFTEAVGLFGREIADKGLALRLDAPHLPMRTDRRRLLQCVVNLVGNAVKFTEQGGIGVVASPSPCPLPAGARGEKYIEIAVEDTGVGIKEEDLPKLFRSFVRLDSPLKMAVPGTGLGLYLTKKMVTEILKGEIMVESDYGKGSRFTMRIPTEAAP